LEVHAKISGYEEVYASKDSLPLLFM
jgi:hypothetical protein